MCTFKAELECSVCGQPNKVTFTHPKDKDFICGVCATKNRIVVSIGTLYEPEVIETTMMEQPEKR